MKEQSHKQEMSSLVQADFARLRARGVETRLAAATPSTQVEEPLPETPEMTERAVVSPVPKPIGGWLARRLRGN
jgi:hypothetical protein